MSYDLNAYVRRDRLPSIAALRERLHSAGGRVVIHDVDDLTTVRGFLPVLLDGTPTGFELYAHEITERQRDAYRRQLAHDGESSDQLFEILIACDVDIGFACKANDPHEVMAARIVANALAEAAQGWFSDPQTSETIRYAAPDLRPVRS